MYASATCRVWTGDCSAALERIVNADAAEIDVIQRCIRLHISLSQPPRGVLLIARDNGNVSNGSRTHHKHSVFLPSELLRSFAVYSPSPLSTSVLVLVDVSASLQQCFFFGALRRDAHDTGGSDASVYNSSGLSSFYGDAETATELLADLHSAFPDVPLSASARELLSSAALARSASALAEPQLSTMAESQQRGRPGALIAKRRRTLSANNFYGDRAPSGALSTASAASAAGLDMDRSAWQSFYEKLQFRVSHSQLCQLQGTAAVSTVFPRQQEAFEFADQVAAFRQRMRESNSAGAHAEPDDDETLRLRLPRVFSFEDAREGKRRFLVATFASFWDDYVHRTHAAQRHVYEIIRERVPCRLYFDLEFKKTCNARVDGDQLVARLVSLVQLQFFRKYSVHVRREHVVQLDSSTSAKFSRHLIIHSPNGELFVDNIHAGNFVRELIHDFVESASKDDDAASPFLVHTGRSQALDPVGSEGTSDAHEPLRQLFIDTGVYTRNRMFRVLGSSKFRRDAVLRHLPLRDARQPQADRSPSPLPLTAADDALFLQTLVCPYPSREAFELVARSRGIRLLRCNLDDSALYRSDGARPLWAPPLASSGAGASSRRPHSQSVESRQSLFPQLDAFIVAQATTGGVQGVIRVVQMLYDDVAVHLPVRVQAADARGTDQPLASQSVDGVSEPVAPGARRTPWMLVYHMARNRWCANVQRAHKSNNVMFIVDLDQRTWYQKCHDQRCKAIDYRSPPVPLPPDLLVDVL